MNIKAFATAIAFGVAACAAALTGARAETLKIGIIAPLTGAAAPWGMAMAEGGKIFASHYNAAGGLDVGGKKYQVQIIAYDDGYSVPGAVTAYNRLVYQDDVKYIVVAAGVSTMGIKQTAADDHVVCMTAGYVADELDPKSLYMYRMWGIPADFFPPLYDWLKTNRPERRVAIVNPNDETARESAVLSEKLYKQNGYEVLDNELYERSLKDFLPLLTKILAAKPDIIDLGTSAPATAALLVRQVREFGFKGPIFIPGSTSWKEVLTTAGPAAAEGVINVMYVDPANQAYKDFAAEYTKAIGQEPNEALAGYADGVNFLIKAIQASGAVGDTSAFEAGFMKAAPFETIQGEHLSIGGKARYGVDHQLNAVRYVGIIRNGAPVVVGKFQ